MPTIRTVDLELLRRGPSHNQLLSPLTDYLANCGDFDTTTVRVPWEHGDLMRAMKALRYVLGLSEATIADRNRVLEQLGKEVAGVLGAVDGLASSTSPTDPHGTGVSETPLLHLNLIVSASELALVPFELSTVPRGCSGHRQNRWLVQESPRICLTRQVRNVARGAVRWPTKPRILFVTAYPEGYAPVPARRHLNALVRAVQPFLGPQSSKEAMRESVGRLVTVLPNATHAQLIETCATTDFTHVHVLAHGTEDPKREGRPFGLALQGTRRSEREHVISGHDFVSCFRTSPSILTVASCDSGNVGDVVYGGASFAHQAHQRGIPFVVASQFPLTFDGSATMVMELYRALLEGRDPREAVWELRHRLHAENSSRVHDWASLVVYGAFPDDLEAQLQDTRYHTSKLRVEAAVTRAEDRLTQLSTNGLPEATREEACRQIEADLVDLDAADRTMPTTGQYDTEGLGMTASNAKRKAETLFGLAKLLQTDSLSDQAEDARQRSFDALWTARDRYRAAVEQNLKEATVLVRRRSLHWVLTQYLCLQRVLGETLTPDQWHAARLSATVELEASAGALKAWAYGTLAELHLIALGTDLRIDGLDSDGYRQEAETSIRKLVEIAQPGSFEITSTRRQMSRYLEWWGHALFEDFLKKKQGERWTRDWKPVSRCVKELVRLLG